MYARKKMPEDERKGVGTELPSVAPVPVQDDKVNIYADEAEISLLDLWRIISKYRALVLGITLSTTVLAGLVLWLTTPLYRAEVLLAPVTDQDGNNRYLQPFKAFGNIAALAGVRLVST